MKTAVIILLLGVAAIGAQELAAGEEDLEYIDEEVPAAVSAPRPSEPLPSRVRETAPSRTVPQKAVPVSVRSGDFVCPDETGFYAHERSCDKYWACEQGLSTLKTCGNGLAFDDTDQENLKENCGYLHNVDCSTRPDLEPAISTTHCEYLHGIFPDVNDCQVFWSCWNGEPSKYTCAPGLAYDPRSRVCTWMDKVEECNKQRTALQNGFQCPAPGEIAVIGSFSRHAHPEDCREYYVCLEGVPREYGCPIGTVFSIGTQEGTGECAEPDTVPGCEDYYGDLDIRGLRALGL